MPGLELAYFYRGRTYQELGEYDNAITDYDEALQIDPDFKPAQSSRGFAYYQSGEFENAIIDISEVLKVRPEELIPLITDPAFLENLNKIFAPNSIDIGE
jgi:tetratricopeptide (TPR) repeat protein